MSVMSPPPAFCNLSVRTVVKLYTLGVLALGGELGFLNCDDVCMCVVNNQFELIEFVFDSVYVDLQYDEISLNFTAGSVSFRCVCSYVVVFALSLRLSVIPYVDAVVDVTVMRVLLLVLHVYMLRECVGTRVTTMLVWG